MELIIISLFLFGTLNINAIHVTNSTENTTIITEERNDLLLERTTEYLGEVENEKRSYLPEFTFLHDSLTGYHDSNNISAYSLHKYCSNNEDCQVPNSVCTPNIYSLYKMCKCKPNYIEVRNECIKKASLYEECLTDEQCQVSNSHCSFISYPSYKLCRCKLNYVPLYKECLEKVQLGYDCTVTEQCLTSNSYCDVFCRCTYNFKEDQGRCVPKGTKIYPSKNNDLDNGIIALYSIFAVIVTVIIILSVITYLRRRSAQLRTQINEVNTNPMPPAYTIQIPPAIERMNTNVAPLQSQASGTTIYAFDKPPSYEDVVKPSS